jgi:hypothetical protein
MVGLRGVGKTVLLDRMRDDAEAVGIHTMRIEAPESRSLPALLAPQIRQALLRLSRNEQARELGQRALRALTGFAKALEVKYADIEVGIDFDPEVGLADNGDLEHDLQALIEAVALAAQKAGTALALFIDELQYVAEDELAALVTALHRTAQRQLPITLVGASLPQLPGRMGRAKSYAERLFDFPAIGPLQPPEAAIAISKPLANLDVGADPEALQRIIDDTRGYLYFLQEWANTHGTLRSHRRGSHLMQQWTGGGGQVGNARQPVELIEEVQQLRFIQLQRALGRLPRRNTRTQRRVSRQPIRTGSLSPRAGHGAGAPALTGAPRRPCSGATVVP